MSIIQDFVGIRSGWTGETVLIFPVLGRTLVGDGAARRTGSGYHVLRLRPAGWWDIGEGGERGRGIGPPLGKVWAPRTGHCVGVAMLADGREIDCGVDVSPLDVAMNIIQYLSDHCDPRLDLERYGVGAGAEGARGSAGATSAIFI